MKRENRKSRARRRLRGGIAISVAVATAIAPLSCSAPERKSDVRRVASQHLAGSVHVSVLAVARWDDYVSSLQPSFQLDENTALSLVLPVSRSKEESRLDARSARVAGTQASGIDDSTKISSATERVDDESSRTTTTIEDRPSSLALIPTTGSSVVPQRYESARRDPSQEVRPDMDPLLQFGAATALFQEVQLLNRYVRDAAVREGFTPYVVRMQVSLMPSARNEPYDAYCTLSFFSKPAPGEAPSDAAGAPVTPLRGSDSPDPGRAASRGTPHVIPLVVTDNLEATLHSRTDDEIRDMAASFFLAAGQLGAAGTLEQTTRDFQRVFGKDLNSLLTVGRVSDNTMRVRLGAMQAVAGSYSMVPRTHTVTALVMVPPSVPRTLDLVARTTMVDAETGEALPDRPIPVVDAEFAAILEKYEARGLSDGTVRTLVALAQANDQRRFAAELRRALPEAHPAIALEKSLWVDLVGVMCGSQYSSAEFDLPRQRGASEDDLFPLQTVLLSDDGDAGATCRVRSVRVASADGLSAYLHVPAGGRELPILAERLEMDDATGDLAITFPSLAAWGLAEALGAAGGLLRLEVRAEGGAATSCEAVYAASGGGAANASGR